MNRQISLYTNSKRLTENNLLKKKQSKEVPGAVYTNITKKAKTYRGDKAKGNHGKSLLRCFSLISTQE